MKKKLFFGVTVIIGCILAVILACVFCLKPKGNKNNSSFEVSTRALGVGSGGLLFSPVISYYDDTVIAISDMGGIYISYDFGQNWERRELQGVCYNAYFDPNTEGTIYVCGSGLYKSVDNGKTFKMIFPKEEEVFASPNRFEELSRNLYNTSNYPATQSVKSVVAQKGDKNHLFCMTFNSNSYTIFESVNGGESFEKLLTFAYRKTVSTFLNNSKLFIHEGELRVFTNDGLFKVEKEGDIYTLKSVSKEENYFENGLVDMVQVWEQDQLYYIFIQNNNDSKIKTRVKYTQDFTSANTTDITNHILNDISNFENFEIDNWYGHLAYELNFRHLCATSINNIFISQEGEYIKELSLLENSGAINCSGVIRYHNGQTSWIYGYPLIQYDDLKTNGHSDKVYEVWGVAVNSQTQKESEILITTLCGVYYSEDCLNIYQRYTKIVDKEKESFTTSGLNSQTTYGIVRDPFNSQRMLLLCTDIGLLISEDGGNSWVESHENLSKWRNTIYDAEFDKYKQGTIYSIWSSRHDAPYEAYDDEISYNYGCFATSVDGGLTWQPNTSAQGLPPNCVPVDMEVIYNGEEEERTIYVATFNHGFYVSYDSGRTFNEMNEGIEKISHNNFNYIFGSKIITTESGKIFALTAKTQYDGGIQKGRVFEYIENKWCEIVLPEKVVCPRNLYFHNDTLYICSTADTKWTQDERGEYFKNVGGGIYTYKNGDLQLFYDETSSISAIQIDDNENIYISDIFGNIYLKNQNYDYKKIVENYHRISKGIQLYNDNILYFATFGGGMLEVKISF